MHCGYYKAVGHNRSGCSQLKATVLREVVEEEEEQVQNEQSAAEQPNERSTTTDQPTDPQPRAQSSRGRKRKPTDKMTEHVEEMMEKAKKKKSKMVVDANGDVDYEGNMP